MKNILAFLIVLIAGVGIGLALSRWSSEPGISAVTESAVAEREILYWKAPMDPNFRRDEPGKSPMGMDLVPVYAGAGDDDESIVTISPQVVNNLGVRTEQAQYSVLSRRIELYERQILSQARDHARASLVAYQSDTADFADVMRGYIDDLNTRVDYIRLQVEQAQSYAAIANLGGFPR